MQAENALDQMDWMEKITGVIASLLSAQTLVHHVSFLLPSVYTVIQSHTYIDYNYENR